MAWLACDSNLYEITAFPEFYPNEFLINWTEVMGPDLLNRSAISCLSQYDGKCETNIRLENILFPRVEDNI